MKNLLLYLRDRQKTESREKGGYLMSHLNSHQKTKGTWTLQCAKKNQKNISVLKIAILSPWN